MLVFQKSVKRSENGEKKTSGFYENILKARQENGRL